MTDGRKLPSLKDTIARHGLSAKKSYGQNFLLDTNLLARIARSAGPLEGEQVYEVGPGPGGLTRALLEASAGRVVAVEADPRCVAALGELSEAWPERLELIAGDALKVDEAGLFRKPAHVVANLPYNVGTLLLVRWLTQPEPLWWSSITVMLQKEVAERISAAPGSKAYGRLSVIAQWRATAKTLFEVPRQAFVPPPAVTSAIVQLKPRPVPEDVPVRALEDVTRAAFGQRRKMLRSALKSLVPQPDQLLACAGIDGERRAETLSLDEFLALARAYGSAQAPSG